MNTDLNMNLDPNAEFDPGRYILDGHTPVKEPDLLKWSKWMQAAKRHVADERIDGIRISTVFLGLDHQWDGGAPLLFETMIFGGPHNDWQERCSTWEEAEEMHKKAVELVKRG